MATLMHAGENRIDRASQIMLGGLRNAGWSFAGPLADLAELEQNTQVFYRMDHHLKPAGLVEEAEREERRPGYEQPRQFRLTEQGEQWVNDHVQEIAMPATREETQRMARDAKDAAESARDSVQSYRKKLSRMKGRVEDLGDELAEVDSRHAHDYDHIEHVDRLSRKAHHRAHENQRAIEDVRTDLENRPTVEDVEQLREDLATVEQDLNDRLGRVESKLDALLRERASVEREQEQRGMFGF